MNSSKVHFVTDIEETMVVAVPAKILIGISLDAADSKELLSWAIRIAARPNDTIVALHVLISKEQTKKLDSNKIDKTRFRQAKAFVISVLGEFAEICQSKQVNLEAKVECGFSIGRGLIEEAKSIGADFLLVGGSRNRLQRTSLEITKYCLEHSPEGCSVVSVGKRGQSRQDSDSLTFEGFHQSGSRLLKKDIKIEKTMTFLPKFFVPKIKREILLNMSKHQSNLFSPTEYNWNKLSPRAVLDGPNGESPSTEEDCSSLGDSGITLSPLLAPKSESHSNKWKQLSVIKLLFPFIRSSFNGTRREEGDLSDKENRKPSLRCFSYEEISNATNHFHPDNIVGRGGYAEVYRGDLFDGQTIAVKRLTKDNTDENKEKEFLTELGVIGHVCHPNTAYLIGCCIENGFHLIFDFFPNGNLSSALHGKTCKALEWAVRYKIAIGIASGLHYLHKCCKHRIIHRDIKASNVLLGPDYEPQISDFGLAKWLPKQWTHHSVIPIEGTFGYLAPEYFMHGIVDEKTDVFAFGVLLLEIITGRWPVDSSKQNLLLWAKPHIECGDIAELADPNLGGTYDKDQLRQLALTASYCVRQSSIWRPSMSEVLKLLTDGHDSEVAISWRMMEYRDDKMDDYYMDVDSQFLTDQILQDI